MRPPIFVRPLTDAERQALTAGLRSPDAFVLRRCQILLASARGERAPRIAAQLGCDDQTVLDAVHAFNAHGLPVLRKGSSRPKRLRPAAFGPQQAQALRALLHQSPRRFGQSSSLWTLEMAADVSFAQGLTSHRVTGETIRQTLQRLGIGWASAGHAPSTGSPAPIRRTPEKKAARPADRAGAAALHLGARLCR
jgi:transposase